MARAISRRHFLKSAAAALALPSIVPARALGAQGAVAPSNRIALGFIGLGTEGKEKNLRRFMAEPDAQVVALCDVHETRLRSAHLAMQAFAPEPDIEQFRGCMTTRDWREVIARDDVDAVVISTPDHWHALIAAAAAQAGKDVFCKKPISHTIHEGRVVADTVRQYGSVFQTATEFRSIADYIRACELVRNGRIGTLRHIETNLYRGFGTPDVTLSPLWKPMDPPEDFDYDMWLGPAPDAPFTLKRCHGTFRFIYDYGGGNITDWGPHINDIAQWGNNTDRTGPVNIEAVATFPNEGLFNTPTDFEVTYRYANGVTFACKTVGPELDKHGGCLVRFEGNDGWILADANGVQASSAAILNSVIAPEEIHLRMCPQGEHRDFLDCVKTRGKPKGNADAACNAHIVCHAANVALHLGRTVKYDNTKNEFIDDVEANRLRSEALREPWRL